MALFLLDAANFTYTVEAQSITHHSVGGHIGKQSLFLEKGI
jgi:hypothetical protein